MGKASKPPLLYRSDRQSSSSEAESLLLPQQFQLTEAEASDTGASFYHVPHPPEGFDKGTWHFLETPVSTPGGSSNHGETSDLRRRKLRLLVQDLTALQRKLEGHVDAAGGFEPGVTLKDASGEVGAVVVGSDLTLLAAPSAASGSVPEPLHPPGYVSGSVPEPMHPPGYADGSKKRPAEPSKDKQPHLKTAKDETKEEANKDKEEEEEEEEEKKAAPAAAAPVPASSPRGTGGELVKEEPQESQEAPEGPAGAANQDNPMEVDFGGDDDDDDEVGGAQPLMPEKAKAEEELEGLPDQAVQSLLDLLEAQKVSHQSLLSKLERLEAARMTEEQRTMLLDALLNRDPALVDHIQKLSVPLLLEVADSQGMTLLHHAVRLGQVEVVELLVTRCPEAVERTTKIDARPARWTALMVLMDTPVNQIGEGSFERIMRCLLHSMSVGAIALQAYTGTTACHLAAAQANLWAVKKICWTMYTKAGETESAFRQVSAMLNSRSGKRGAGAVDLALGTNLPVANYLKMWGGEEQCPNPKRRWYYY